MSKKLIVIFLIVFIYIARYRDVFKYHVNSVCLKKKKIQRWMFSYSTRNVTVVIKEMCHFVQLISFSVCSSDLFTKDYHPKQTA